MDNEGFRINIRKDLPDKPDRCSFEVLDSLNTFRFRSKLDFATEEEARVACKQLLHSMTDARHYRLEQNPADGRYHVEIRAGEEDLAVSDRDWATEQLALSRIRVLTQYFRKRIYKLSILSTPFRWKFNFQLGLPGTPAFILESRASFETKEEAITAAQAFHAAGPDWPDLTSTGPLLRESAPTAALLHLLKAKADLYAFAAGDQQHFSQLIRVDEPSKSGSYVYRLVDKDHPRAYHPGNPGNPGDSREKAEEIRNQLIMQGLKGYSYLEICMGGDNISPDQTGNYFYQLRCRNDYFSNIGIHPAGGELVLFESVTGYGSEADAQSAFLEK
jgi:hypothetical protein